MTWWEILIWWSLAIIGLLGSFLFSGLETGIYTLNHVRLQIQAHRRGSDAAVLAALVARPARLLATLLILNNVVNNLGAASITVILKDVGFSDGQIVLYVVLGMTPIFFVFGEMLPKDLFAAHSDHLVYPFARLLRAFMRLFTWTGLLPLIMGVSNAFMRLLGVRADVQPFGQRRLVGMLVKEGVGRGLLSDDQSAIVERVLALGGQTVGEVMKPWSQVIKVNADDPPARLWELANQTSHARFPVVDGKGAAIGTLEIFDALVHDVATCPPVRELLKSPFTLDARTPLREALSHLQTAGRSMAIITDHNRTVGIATFKDLLEPITGEMTSW